MGINATGAAPAVSAMLDVSSNTKGFLPPRMTTAQRLAISSPVKGLVVYDTGEDELYLYKGTGDIWYKLSLINPPLTLTSPTLTPIIGINTNPNPGSNAGVKGETTVNNGGGMGVHGVSRYATPPGHNYGVFGENLSTNSFGVGVNGLHLGTGVAVRGDAPGGGTAIQGVSSTGRAANFANSSDILPTMYVSNAGNFTAALFLSNTGSAVEAISSSGIAVYGSSNTTSTTGFFLNTGGGVGVAGFASSAGVGGIMEVNGTGNGLNTTAVTGKALYAKNNSATNATGRFENAGSGFGIQSLTSSGAALYGFSGTGNGLYAETNGGTAAAARIVNNNGTGNAIDATNNSATNATGRFENSGNYHAIQAISYGSSATGRFVNNSTGYGIHATANDVSAYAGYFNNIAGNGVFIYAGAGTGATITSAGKAIEAYGGGIENSIVATNTSATKATVKLRNNDANGAAVELQGQISIPSSATNRAIFQHTTAVGNVTGNYTTLSYPNALATDFLMVTQIFGSVGNPNVVAVDYFGGAWVIYNVNGASMLINARYNVLVIRQ
jgi:hypothetical protein